MKVERDGKSIFFGLGLERFFIAFLAKKRLLKPFIEAWIRLLKIFGKYRIEEH